MARELSSWNWGRGAVLGFGLRVLAAVFLVVVWASSAQAAKRRAGVAVSGPHAGAIRGAIDGALERHALETTSVDVASEGAGAIADAAKRDKLAALLVGQVQAGGKKLKLRVYGANGDVLDEASWSEANVKKLEVAVGRTLWARVGGALAKARPPAEKSAKGGADAPAPAKAPEQSAEEAETAAANADEAAARKRKKRRAEEEDQEPDAPTGPAGIALDVGVGPRFVSRHFTWSPAVPALRGYSLGYAPSFGASLAWYPLAHARGGWAANLGIAVSVEYTPGLTSQTSDGASYPTSESDYWAGVRGRALFGIAQASLTLAGGQQTYVFQSSATANRANLSDLPDTKYTYGRAALDLRLALPADLSLMLGAGYRYVFSAGADNDLIQANSYFPDSTFVAFDAMAAAGYRPLSLLEVRAGFDVRRYQMTAGTNAYNVSGATDQYLAFWFQLALLLDGYTGGSAAHPAPKPAAAPPPERPADDQEE
jgi:hypothetical protein